MPIISGDTGREGGPQISFLLEPLGRNSADEPVLYHAKIWDDAETLFERTFEVSSFSGHVCFRNLATLLEEAVALVDSEALVWVWDSPDPRYRKGGEQTVRTPHAEFSLRWIPRQMRFVLGIQIQEEDQPKNGALARFIATQIAAPLERIQAFGQELRKAVEPAFERDNEFFSRSTQEE